MSRKFKIRLISLILLLATLFTLFPVNAVSLTESDGGTEKTEPAISDDLSKVIVLHNGAGKKQVQVNEDGKETLTYFVAGITPSASSWQIRTPDQNTWVNIQGYSSDTLPVGYALVGSMLNSAGIAYIRASVTANGTTYYSEPVEISIVYNTGDGQTEFAAPMMMRAAAASTDAPEDFRTYSIVINYIFDNGGLAYEPYGATVAKGSDFHQVVESPSVTGYEPFRRIDGEYVSAKTVDINLSNINENVTINVIYEPAIVDYQIHHHYQDITDDAYSATYDRITYGKGLTGSIVGDNLALDIPGFKALAYEKLTVAADGSTIVEIRYDRKYYLVEFDMQGGFGVEPLYVRYGTPIGANQPIRHGYVFDGWELVKYGDRDATPTEASKYDINDQKTIELPDASLRYRAKWITQLTKYTMVFWKENIEDNGFSYWGHLDGLAAMSGSTVSGSDRVREVDGITDENCFTYNDSLTDKNVLVEGDGSTVVNVYYTRNRYTITFKAPGLCTIPENHSHTDSCYHTVCTKGHVHNASCLPTLTCDQPEHTAHTDTCIICGKVEHAHGSGCCSKSEHTHTTSCFKSVGAVSTLSNAPVSPGDGYIHRSGNRYYIYIGGAWYRYNGWGVSGGDFVDASCGYANHTHGSANCSCTAEVHSHTDSCYRDTLHTHDTDRCYSYSCGDVSHTHTNGCFVLTCPITVGHSHSSTCDRKSSTNVVKTVTYKYQQNLESLWPITDDNGVKYDSGERWDPSDSDTYSEVLVFIANMPGDSFTLTLNEANYDAYVMNYYLEVLDGESYDVEYSGRYYRLYTTIKAKYNYLTKAEDFFDINGFVQSYSSPAFGSNGQLDINGGGTVNFYYTRIVNQYLEFQSNGIKINTHTVSGIPYGASLKEYNFTPDYPSSLEPGAYVFKGWYTSPGHYDGTEVNWETITMSAGDMLLYAKWEPSTHTVEVYFDNTCTQQIGTTQYVLHGNFALAPTETVTNGSYIFQGWFYSEVVDGITVEKAFVFTGIPVSKDLKIYAKWSSHVTVDYKITYVFYKANGDKVEIADATVSSGIAGNNKTFYAKAGDELYEGYREGYYPLTSSHTITMSPEMVATFEFRYVYVESMPYIVRYLDGNGVAVFAEKKVVDNNLSVVTETFVKIDKMMPDGYQKRLVLSASGTDADGDGVFDQNVITFNYSVNETHAYYRVVHYIQHITDGEYREYRSEDAAGLIGNEYSFTPLALTGFTHNTAKTTVNGVSSPTVDGKVSATLTSEGLLINLYYDRVNVDYVVKYLESGTNTVLYEEKNGSGIYGGQVIEYAPSLAHKGYTLVSESVQQLHLSTNESLNVIRFYYQESYYSIKYQIVGPTNCGVLSHNSENIKAVSGVPNGSAPLLSSGYHFVGWFLDENCTRPVPSEWVDPVTNKLVPESNGIWLESSVYYAKIEPDFTSLTISTVGCIEEVDENQVFIFRVKGTSALTADVDVTVTIIGNGSVTLEGLPIGSLTVTEITNWSYRYTPDASAKDITLSTTAGQNTVLFSHIRTVTKWLDGNSGR